MKLFLLLLSIISAPASAQSITPNFTTGTMTQTVTATQTVNETVVSERVGSALTVWNGDNVRPEVSGVETTIQATGVDFAVVDPSHPWQLEIQTRQAGVVETINTTRVIQTDTVTNTLSVFAQ
jgi:hypothetical protein